MSVVAVVTANDDAKTINKSLKFTVEFVEPSPDSIDGSNQPPYFISSPSSMPSISCDQLAVNSWSYPIPQAADPEQNLISLFIVTTETL